ncbi:unnamed protein product, partial [Aureobasidium pullulans]
AIAPVLATVCGVATAVAAFQPELQKQAAEREGKNVEQFQEQHGGAIFASFLSILHLCIHSTLHPISATLLLLTLPPYLPPTQLISQSPAPNIPRPLYTRHQQQQIHRRRSKTTPERSKDEAMTEIQHIKNEAKTDVAPQKAWWGLGLFGASQGGSESPREGEKKS